MLFFGGNKNMKKYVGTIQLWSFQYFHFPRGKKMLENA